MQTNLTPKVELCIAMMEAMMKRMRAGGRKVPKSVLRQLHASEQELAELREHNAAI